MSAPNSATQAGLETRTYHERVVALVKTAPKLTTEQQRKLATTFGGGPR